jgi:hypothetical protein
MFALRGFQYEKSIFNMLMQNNLTEQRYSPAASSHESDTAFKIKNKVYNLEVKLDLNADFGQGTLRYDIDNKTWVTYSDNRSMKKILDFFEVADFANESWKGVIPYSNYKHVDIYKKRPPQKRLLPHEDLSDRRNFTDNYKKLTGNPIADYYNSKDVYYIQIGKNKGFYYMGKDIANLGVPEFNPTEQKIRIRRKEGRFTTAILISTNVPSSLYNLDYNAIFLINKNK